MAEAIELQFQRPTERSSEDTPTLDPIVSSGKVAKASLPPKSDEEMAPPRFTFETYYENDDLGRQVLKDKYLAPWESSPWELWVRQAKAIAGVETTGELQQEWTQRFLDILEDFRFVPGGRIMHGAGRDDIKTTLNNCYVVGIREDSIPAIYKAIIDEAMTYKYGGGCGHDLSGLRPSGSQIGGTGGESCGPTGFMDLFSMNTNTIAQHGRRGANMQTLRVDHPDIEKFIEIKCNLDKVKYSNISVLLTHKFMQAVIDGTDFDLAWNGEVYRTVEARDLWHRIITAAHSSAEPGLIFWDTMKEYHNGEYCSPLVSTNPCAEQPLPDGGCCNLGSVNLERFVDEHGTFRMNDFKQTVRVATRFLDNVIDYNIDRHALETQRQNALKDRRIGLGILGLGDMLVRMHVKYDSDKALEIVDGIASAMCETAYNTSVDLAVEKGSFPNFEWKGYSKSRFVKNLPPDLRKRIAAKGIRNVTILTVPPTGSGAIVAQVTSGIEPIFATSYQRRVKQNAGYGDTFKDYKVYHTVIRKMFGTDESLPDYVVTAHDIDPYFRVRMQGVIQKYIDSSISSTVNLHGEIDVETVADIYLAAYKEKLKGITVYREGSREGILISNTTRATPEGGESDTAPRMEQPPADQQLIRTGAGDTRSTEGPVEEVNIVKGHPLRPRMRPHVTEGGTRRIRTGEGNLYVTLNRDERGLCEVFTTIGKAGGNAAAQAEAISRLISLALRCGIDAREIIKQLRGISGPNPIWDNGKLILSTPDAIGQALESFLESGSGPGQSEVTDRSRSRPAAASIPLQESASPGTAYPTPEDYTPRSATTCPECGSTVFHQSGCVTCPHCGYSKC